MGDALDRYVAERDVASPGFSELVEKELAAVRVFDDLVNAVIGRADDLGLTRAELAERVGMAPSNLSRLLNSSGGNPTFETVTKLAAAVGCDVALVDKRVAAMARDQ